MSRVFGIPIVCALVFVSFINVPAAWLHEPLVARSSAGERISLAAELRRSARLTQESDIVFKRLAIKGQIADQLIADELTLYQAAARFLALHNTPQLLEWLRRAYPSSSDAESACLHVIAWVEGGKRSRHSPQAIKTIRQRLEAELREHLQCYGSVELPE